MSPTQALKTAVRTTVFTPQEQRFKENFISGLKQFKDEFKHFRKLAGWKSKFDPNKLRWDKENGVYIYDNKIMINFKNSPFSVDVSEYEENIF